jgi:hypothetical protein
MFRRNISPPSSGSKNKPSTLKMEAICSSQMSVDFQRTIRRYIPEYSTLHKIIYFRNFLCIQSFPQPKDIIVTSSLLAFICLTLDRGPYRVLSAGASRTLFFFFEVVTRVFTKLISLKETIGTRISGAYSTGVSL